MFTNFGLLDFDMPELIVILAIVLLLFGGKKLPELSKSLGQSMREVRKGFSEVNETRDAVKNQLTQTKQAVSGKPSSKTVNSNEVTQA